MNQNNSIGIIVLLCLLLPVTAYSLTSDKEKPILVEADSVDINQTTGVSIYKGDVEVVRGSMKLTGSLARIYQKEDELEKIYIEGKHAKYKQLQDNGKEVKAQAYKMEYFNKTELLHLYNDATVWQVKDTVSSEKIIYNTLKDTVQAGNADSNNADKKDRVKFVIQPKQK